MGKEHAACLKDAQLKVREAVQFLKAKYETQ